MTPAATGAAGIMNNMPAEPEMVRKMLLARQMSGKPGDYVTVTTNNSLPTSGYTVVTPAYNTTRYPALALMGGQHETQ